MFNYNFSGEILSAVVGGKSSIDQPRLQVRSLEEAELFIQTYGYDLKNEAQREQVWQIFKRAVALITDELLDPGEKIPEELIDSQKLGDPAKLLVLASSRLPENRELQRWACAILRVMHVYIHLRHDVFDFFAEDIQAQIFRPFQNAITDDPVLGSTFLGRTAFYEGIKLHRFECKPLKTTASSVIKLLARPERVALTLLDKLGVRFVTKSVFDAFRVIRYLTEEHIISYPHIIPDQSADTLYPLNLFLEAMQELREQNLLLEPHLVEEFLEKKLAIGQHRADFLEKANQFSDKNYKFVKFIARRLINVRVGSGEQQRDFRFFYPYEVQIMDYQTYLNTLSGPMAHDAYKERQRGRARSRALGLDIEVDKS